MDDVSRTQEFQQIKSAVISPEGLIECNVLPVRGAVVFPQVVTAVGLNSAAARMVVERALLQSQTLIGFTLRDLTLPEDDPRSYYPIGVELAPGHTTTLFDGIQSALVQGRQRVELVQVLQSTPFLRVQARPLAALEPPEEAAPAIVEMQALFQRVTELNLAIPEEARDFILSTRAPGSQADLITATLSLPVEPRQRVLELLNVYERVLYVNSLLNEELRVLELKDEINMQTQQELEREQREIYLREQMRVIQSELGEEDFFLQEMNEVREQILRAQLPLRIHERALKELGRLQVMPPMAPEVGIIRTYIDWLTELPWSAQHEDNLDLKRAQQVLDAQHYGLPKAKDRILEHIAVRKLAAEQMKTPILCFVGPPGVGKTSLGKSIADALGREFLRVSLGGVHDEAEIRGHRRTYIGALPGRIIQTLRQSKTINPVFMLDEIDKLGADFRGDPASALLEVLDPEQNVEYVDHYLDVSYDLSKVFFITTANDLDSIPDALLDRLEVIEFSGYGEEEKLDIARQFLIPKQLEQHGLAGLKLRFETAALETLIRDYTYEAGVRNLSREIANVLRKIARMVAEDKPNPQRITNAQVSRMLGPPPYMRMRANDQDAIGVATGLAWTPGGGDVLTIEVSIMPGKGTLLLTGHLGDIMQESAQAALSYMRAHATQLDVPHEDFENYDVHVHLPEGAVPKDGPSAGITLAAAIISAFTERKVRCDYAMTGEMTLHGRVLPVGGVKEKVLSARRARIRNIILPAENHKDLVDLPKHVLRDLDILFVDNMQQVIDSVLLEPPSEGRQRDLEQQALEDEPEEQADNQQRTETVR